METQVLENHLPKHVLVLNDLIEKTRQLAKELFGASIGSHVAAHNHHVDAWLEGEEGNGDKIQLRTAGFFHPYPNKPDFAVPMIQAQTPNGDIVMIGKHPLPLLGLLTVHDNIDSEDK